MRKALWIIVGLAAMWCIWWAIAAFGLSKGVSVWFEDRRAHGWRAEHGTSALNGFPARIAYSLDDIALYDPAAALDLSIPGLVIDVSALWPGNTELRLADAPTRITTPRQALTISTTQASANIELHPGTALELEALRANTGPFRVEDRQGHALYGGQAALMSFAQEAEQTRYIWRFEADAFTPGDRLRHLLNLPSSWPLVFETFTGHVTIDFDAPLELNNVETRPQPQRINISQLEAHWGEMRILATGEVVQDARGYARGALVIKAENWPQLLDLAVAMGLMLEEFKPQATNILSALAQGSGKTNDLDITLTFEDGRTKIGIIPLGPAPRLAIR